MVATAPRGRFTSRPLGPTTTRLLMVILAVALVALQLRDVFGYSAIYTDEDQTLLWLAGRDIVHLHWRAPNFWGQTYNVIFEALPGELMHLIGVSLRVADPLGVAGMVAVAWGTIAWVAYRRGHPVSAALALGLPLLVSLNYLLCFDQLSGVVTGDLLAALAVAAVVGLRRPALRLGVVIALAGLAYQWDNASVTAGGPAVVAALCTDWRTLRGERRRTAKAVGLGVLLPVAWFIYHAAWFAAYPGRQLDPNPALGFSLSVMWHNLMHPTTLFSFYAPELLDPPWLAELGLLALVLGTIAVGVRHRRLTPVAVAVSFALVVLAALSVRTTSFNFAPNIYLAGSRFLLPMLWGAWLVAHQGLATPAAARADRAAPVTGAALDRPAGARGGLALPRARAVALALPRARAVALALPRARAVALAVVAGLSVASAIASQVRFDADRAQLVAGTTFPESIVTVENAHQLLANCQTVAAAYRADRAQMLVSLDRPFTYGCAAETGINTLYPTYDRRYWVIDQAASQPMRRIMFEGGYSCVRLPPGLGTCQALPDGLFLRVGAPATVATVLAALNIPLWDGPLHPNLATGD